MMNAKKIWEARSKILEGIKNNIFKSEAVEEIAYERNEICKKCPDYDAEGTECMVAGTAPCCGICGCSLKLKLRSLSSGCGNEESPLWSPVLTDAESMDHEILNPEDDE